MSLPQTVCVDEVIDRQTLTMRSYVLPSLTGCGEV